MRYARTEAGKTSQNTKQIKREIKIETKNPSFILGGK
jgi:hypothetical protein